MMGLCLGRGRRGHCCCTLGGWEILVRLREDCTGRCSCCCWCLVTGVMAALYFVGCVAADRTAAVTAARTALVECSLHLASAQASHCILGLVSACHIAGFACSRRRFHIEAQEPLSGQPVTRRGSHPHAGCTHYCSRSAHSRDWGAARCSHKSHPGDPACTRTRFAPECVAQETWQHQETFVPLRPLPPLP